MGYKEKDAAKDTNTSTSKTAEAWHGARDDAARSGDLNERNVSDSPEGKDLYKELKDAGMVPDKK
jgi:hypothetical protein